MKDKIALFGAYDRYNYGDLLFPLIFRKFLEDKYPFLLDKIEYFSLTSKDLSKYGGIKTKSLEAFQKSMNEFGFIVVLGGQIFGSRWSNLYFHNMKNYSQMFFYRVLKKLKILNEEYFKKLFNSKFEYPYIFTNNELNNNIKVFYNAVGGNPGNRELIKKIDGSYYLSVRDNYTKSIFENARLYPDSAILMSDFFTNINHNIRKCIREMNFNYIGLQINYSVFKQNKKQIFKSIDEIYKRYGMKIVLINIGYAPLHDDFKSHKILNKAFPNKTILFEDTNIFEIMYLIKNSQIFLGTSLHGNITAMSYNVPHLGFEKINKLKYFLKTWENNEISSTFDFFNIIEKIDKYLNLDRAKLKQNTDSLKKLAYENLNNIACEIIKAAENEAIQ